MVVRYEDLVSRTESTTKSICHFLDVAFDPLMLRSEEISESLGDVPLLHEHKEVSAPINTENIGSGRVDLSYTDREQLESVIGKELKIFGYPSCISSNAV